MGDNVEKLRKDHNHRKTILEEGIALTTGDRNKTYGEPYDGLQFVAEVFDPFLRRWPDAGPGAHHAAILNGLQKLVRAWINPGHRDSSVDGAVYTAMVPGLYEAWLAEHGEEAEE